MDPLGLSDLLWTPVVAAIAVAAAAFGVWVLDRLKVWFNRPLDVAFGGGIGLLALALLTFGLSLLDFIPQWLFIAIPVAMLAVGARPLWRRLAGMARPEPVLTAAIVVTVAATLSGVTMPPGHHDDLTYHLVLPKEIFIAGGYVRLDGWNVCASFPQNTEMLNLYGMVLTDSVTRGVVVGRMFNVAGLVFIAIGVYGAALRFTTPRLAAFAAAMVVLLPGTIVLAAVRCSTEVLQALGALLAAAAAIWILAGDGTWRTALVGGLMAGLAAGAKYPSIVMAAIPLAALLLALGRARAAIVFGAGALLAFAPWGVRGVVENHNPVHPLAFTSPNWSDLEAARLERFSGPQASSELGPLLETAVTENFELNVLLFLFPLALLRRRPDRPTLLLAGAVAIFLLIWFFFTHRYIRFLAPMYPWIGLLTAMSFRDAADAFRKAGTLVCAIWLISMGLLATLMAIPAYVQRAANTDAEFNAANLPDMPTVGRGPVLLVGECRTYWQTRPYVTAHPFNRHPFYDLLDSGADRDAIAAWLRERRIVTLVVNWSEIERYRRDYTFTYEGREIPGVTLRLTQELLESLGLRRTLTTETLVHPTIVYEVETGEAGP